MIACICGGIIETGVALGLIVILRPFYRFLNKLCAKQGCKCNCHKDIDKPPSS